MCAQGNAKYVSHDYEGASAAYRKAIERAPHQALAYYLLGEAQLASGNLADAESSWNRAALEVGEKDPALRAKILFVTADLKERQKKWEDAKAAWQTYLDWANRFPDAGVFPATAQSRLTILDTVIKQDKAYEIVRQRIAASQDGGVFSDPSKSPPAK
jgi:tetratricopeptide (TPR) repeat protein